MSRPRRNYYSDLEVDQYVKEQAIRRADARTAEMVANPERWRLVVDPEWPQFGLTWQEIKEG